jgi:phosphoribosylamine-glycine ligase
MMGWQLWKGVVVAECFAEASAAIDSIMNDKTFGQPETRSWWKSACKGGIKFLRHQ